MTDYLTGNEPKPWYLTKVFAGLLYGTASVGLLLTFVIASTKPSETFITMTGISVIAIFLIAFLMIVLEYSYWRTWRHYQSRVKGVVLTDSREELLAIVEDSSRRTTMTIELENGHRFQVFLSLEELSQKPFVTYGRRCRFMGSDQYRNIEYTTDRPQRKELS